jgi:hypothetical protein
MALSRYSVLPDQKIVNTHVADDLTLTNRVLATKQQAYNEAEAFDQQQEGVFGKYLVRNVDIARRDQLHDEYVQKAQDLVQQKYQGDYGAALPELRRLANGTAGNEFWNRATSALGRQKDMYETEKTIQKKGGTSLAFDRSAADRAIYNPEDGSYRDVDFDVQERSDWSKPKLELMKDIAKDGRLTGLSQAQIAGVLQHGSMKGVDAGKVLGVARQMLGPYLSTPEGQQEMRYYTKMGGYTPQQAMGRMLKDLGGIGSKQVGMERDMDYMGNPGYDKEAGKVKDTSLLSIGQTSGAVDVERLSGLSADMFKRQDRDDKGKAAYVGQIGSTGPGGFYRPTQNSGIHSYAALDENQRNKAADLIQATYPKYAEKLRAGTISQQGMDVIAPAIAKRVKALGNLKVGAAVNMIAPDRDYGSYGKGEEGLTKALLGTDKLDNIPSGKLIGTTVYTPDGKTLSGKDFIEQVWKPAQKAAKEGKLDGTARITGEFGAANPYSLLTNNEAFGDAKQLTIGGDQYVIAGLDEKENHTVSQRAKDGTERQATYVKDLSGIRRAKAAPITKAMRNTGVAIPVTLGNAKFRLKWNEDGTFTFPDQPDPSTGKPLVTDNPEAVLDLYLSKMK